VSKASRRRQRPGTNPSTPKPASAPPPPPQAPQTPQDAGGAAGSAAASSATPASTGATAGTPRATGTPSSPAGTPRPSTSRPTSARAGRRDRQRTYVKPSFRERYRTAIIVVAALAGIALLSTFVFLSAAQPAYACSTVWSPAPTASPTAGATPALGYVQPEMGRTHVAINTKVTYTYCAPASGNHFNRPGAGGGPIPARLYGPNDNIIPQGWIHNLEHGAIVILYRGNSAGATPEGQAQLRALYERFPNSPVCDIPKGEIAPVMARFDQMSTPFQAIVWGRVLPLETLDDAAILAFYQQWGERTNPEKQCAPASASPSVTTAPSDSATPSTAPSTSAAPSQSTAPSAAPSASTAPSPS